MGLFVAFKRQLSCFTFIGESIRYFMGNVRGMQILTLQVCCSWTDSCIYDYNIVHDWADKVVLD